ncbi:ABC transporter permease/M1 family aminopeptidase [Rufibacter latericius]|uniref:Uncharacterized protein n=1 Tax=Rufibacter latericius TaxID=2487040 RepID=A0A3M9MFZ9_9BACT|nr:ABC transporter permease [Rufibacter latericius]RNI23558.1 hypothetical protein EFB08_18685 [Rufibacter latericius]
MKFWKIFSFEFAYQIRRPWPWLVFVVLIIFAFFNTRVGILPVTLPKDFILNSPFIITAVTVFSCQIWLLLAAAVPGEASARDVHTRMYPLLYTSPISRAEYLGGRFLAAFTIHAIILLGTQVGSLLAVYAPGMNPDIVGPFRPEAYLAAYGYIGLSNAFIATVVQFSLALLSRRPMVGYFGSLLLFFLSYPVTFTLYMNGLGKRALMADPIGIMAIMNEMMTEWTIVEKNVRMFTLEGAMLWNRLLWLGIAVAMGAFIYLRFRFVHHTGGWSWKWKFGNKTSNEKKESEPIRPFPLPTPTNSYSFSTHLWQTLATARSSFWMIVTSPAGLFLLVVFPVMLTLIVLIELEHWGIPLLPRTPHLLTKHLTGILTTPSNYWVMVPLFTVYFAGELIWRERDAGLNENIDATPVPEWVLFVGKFIGLGLVLALLMVIIALVGITVQVVNGYYDFQIGRYLQVLLGFQLTDYLLFAALAFTVQVVVNQKYVGYVLALVAYFCIIFSSFIGVEHNLLVYASGPAWSFTEMRGFGGTVGPWLWLRLYWFAWALLLALVARLFWMRGRESGSRVRFQLAKRRFTRSSVGVAVAAGVLILTLGSFIFYNTNVLNEHLTDEEMVQRRADYERLYGKYEGIAQPQRTATKLQIEIYPEKKAATIRGSYRLVNRDAKPIKAIHVEPAFYVETRITFDHPARAMVTDEKRGHFIYALDQPLQPGDSLTLNFDVKYERRGFRTSSSSPLGGPRRSGAGTAVLENGSYFPDGALPVIGYQPMRELWSAEDRRKQGLPRQVTLEAPGDIDQGMASVPAATFEAIISTDAGQVAVAPGELRRTWSKEGRSYFHYVSDVPINGTDVFFSADYKVYREKRNQVDLQLFLHPGHTKHAERLLRSARAALDYYSAQFGPYPYRYLQIVEQPGNFMGMGVDGSGVITGGEGFFLLDPQGEGFDAMFEIVAHEMGHQWWGMQLKPAFAEGGGVISESLAWYSAMQLVKKEKGREALRRFMAWMREPNPWPPIRTGLPLLRAMDPWANYRKGPYAMHALSEYAGEERVNVALRSLVQKKASSLATTLDMYRELQVVTPDSLKPMLHDLFETNTFWTFDTKQASVKQTGKGAWQVTLEVDAHKTVSDSAGYEKEVPVNQWVEIGLFAAAEPGEILGKPLYVQKHFIRKGLQTITVTLPSKPARGGIDPYNLLDWEEGDNIEKIQPL